MLLKVIFNEKSNKQKKIISSHLCKFDIKSIKLMLP
jgi:hypothetical protein